MYLQEEEDSVFIIKVIFDELSHDGKSLLSIFYLLTVMINIFIIIKIFDIIVSRFINISYATKLFNSNSYRYTQTQTHTDTDREVYDYSV
jgi:hypothetical protein